MSRECMTYSAQISIKLTKAQQLNTKHQISPKSENVETKDRN